MYGFEHYAGGWNWPMVVGSVVFWVLLALAIVALIRYLTQRDRPWAGAAVSQPGPPPYQRPAMPSPDGILAERFARGEIDEQEYRHRLATLRGEAPGQPAPPGVA